MAGHQGPRRLIAEYQLICVLDKGEREANSTYFPSAGDPGILSPNIPPSDMSFLAYLLDHSVLLITNSGLSAYYVQRFGKRMSQRPIGSQLGWQPGPEKIFVFKQENKKYYVL